MEHSETTTKVQAAIVASQAAMQNPGTTTKNAFLGNEYLPLPQLIDYARPILAEHGLAILQTPTSHGERVGVTTTIIHESGEWLRDSVSLPVESRKGNTLAQVAGGVITYLRRYAYAAACGIAPDPDDDGNHGGDPKQSAKPQQEAAQDKLENARTHVSHAISTAAADEKTAKSWHERMESLYAAEDVDGLRSLYTEVKATNKQGEIF